MQSTITINMPPILAKFLKYKLAESPDEPLQFHKKHFVNKFLKANLINIDKLTQMQIDEKENVKQYYSPTPRRVSEVELSIPTFSGSTGTKTVNKKLFILNEKKRLFVNIIKSMYEYEFEKFYWENVGESKQKIANLWLEQLHIDDEILPKSQWRAIYRKITL